MVISPGPNGLLIAKTVPTQGKKAGFVNVLGFLAAFYLHGALSILGISVLLTQSAEAFFIVKVVGALYLSWIGVKSLISAYRNVDAVNVKTATRGFAPISAKSPMFVCRLWNTMLIG